MAFDWFRRQYVQAEQTPDPSAGSSAEPSSEPETSPPESASELDPQADYLAFAKAAYANIKARQQAEQPVPSPAAATAPIAEQSAEHPEEQSSEPAPQDSDNADTAILDSITLEDDTDTETTEVKPNIEIEPQDPTSSELTDPVQSEQLPGSAPSTAFFDLAPRARQRLEALAATALEEPPPPDPVAVQTETPPTEIPGLRFDEGFRWSADLLAAQGRKPEEVSVEEITWLQKLRQGLGKTRLSLINQLKALVGRGPIDQEAVEEIETLLLQADVGVDACERLISALQQRMRQQTLPPEEAVRYLKAQMREMLTLGDPTFAPERETLNIWLIVGVNGAGKTTTIGKLAHIAKQSGYNCLVAAGDTFRAAAVEQLKVWGQRAEVEVIANPGQNTDPAAVVFDAVTAAQARQVELLLVDTAGRLQNKKNLMEELSKIRRIIDKKAPHAKIESLLVLDATLGQNGLRQAEVFAQAAQLSGVVLTKLDSTAKGGIAFAITQQLGLPIRFIGAGEGIEDLRPFSSYEFVEALVSEY